MHPRLRQLTRGYQVRTSSFTRSHQVPTNGIEPLEAYKVVLSRNKEQG
ncbi:hypothetical protein HOR87_gp01 [Marinomonas phage CB5A]|uniref:Uncharacterized protein n=1 Tax=Marinomonas phage CB5A TaxID=2022859 RepID=A0A222G3C5_9CAUD|nr:hypothetical protein HOR87_gp01 [Marinomonas phage CB5A]ASP46289.1 hypothetical protein [Marinomonas phage CB5A]